MKVHLHRRYHFSASHRLHAASLSDGDNRAVFGKCNNPFGHGHNYAVEVTVSGAVDPVTGMVINLADLDSLVEEEIVGRFDRANLNMDEDFLNTVPTTENLNIAIYDKLHSKLQQHVPPVKLEQVRVEETSNNTFDYAGKEEILR